MSKSGLKQYVQAHASKSFNQPIIACINVSPPHHGGAVPAPLSRGRPKWRGNFPEGPTIRSPPIVHHLLFHDYKTTQI